MSSLVQPNVVLKKGGLKIGIFGLGIDLEGLVSKENTNGLIYKDPVEIAQQQALILKQKGCDYVICLSHLGFEYPTNKISDKLLASQTSGIDLIIGGHTHTFLDAPVVVKNANGKDVLINQVGYGGLNLGRIDIQFSSEFDKTIASESLALTSKWDLT
jgi:5'-nucleotidase